jgi:ribonuclease VapC
VKADRASYVLDSYAVLAYLQGEACAGHVRSLIEMAQADDVALAICLVNLGEVLHIVERKRGLMAAHQVIAALEQLPLSIVAADRSLTFAAAHVKANCTLSYADAFSVALGQRLGAAIVTGDAEFHSAEALVEVMWLEQSEAH